jgi:aspartyl-tRNA(Asn)/glutamyl-tRNA(Gln) amidotransferase subunit A
VIGATTVAEASAAIRAGQMSAVELIEATLARVERLNPRLNAYVHVDGERALAEARAVDRQGALAGIPVCVKDMIDVAGLPTCAGAAHWRRVPERDAPAVARLRAAGAVIVGKGHTNEFAYGIDGENPHWGACSNPYDTARICGGSSSGPAVATAAGLALAGLGTDTSGSIRVPSALCGLIGIRPTVGRVPREDVVPLAWTYDVVGPLCRSVEDAVLLLETLLDRPLGRPDLPGRPRLGVVEELFEGAETHVAEGVLDAARDVAELVPVRFERLRYAEAVHQLVQYAEAAEVHTPWLDEEYAPDVRTRLEAGRLLPAGAYLAAQRARRLIYEEVAEKMAGLDALVAPTVGFVAPAHGTVEVGGRPLRAALQTCVVPPSEAGGPVVSVPVGSHERLPFAMQVIGRPRAEAVVLEIAARVERRWPWPERRAGEETPG